MCNVAASGEPVLANIVTGVAIADAEKEELYFGCVAGISGIGGLGHLSQGQEGQVTIKRVFSNDTKTETLHPLYAGSMIVTDACNHGVKGLPVLSQAAPDHRRQYTMILANILILLIAIL